MKDKPRYTLIQKDYLVLLLVLVFSGFGLMRYSNDLTSQTSRDSHGVRISIPHSLSIMSQLYCCYPFLGMYSRLFHVRPKEYIIDKTECVRIILI